jgi:hypothetical protein
MTGSEDSTLHPSAPIRNTTNICSSTDFARDRQLSGRQLYGKQLDTKAYSNLRDVRYRPVPSFRERLL